MESSRIKRNDTAVNLNNIEAQGLVQYFKTNSNFIYLIQ